MNPLQKAESDVEGHKKNVEILGMLQRLFDNEDFKKLILRGYIQSAALGFLESSANLTLLREDGRTGSVPTAIKQALLVEQARAPGHLRKWMEAQETQGLRSLEALDAAEALAQEFRDAVEQGYDVQDLE